VAGHWRIVGGVGADGVVDLHPGSRVQALPLSRFVEGTGWRVRPFPCTRDERGFE